MSHNRLALDVDDLILRYLSGSSENKLAKELGVSRVVVRRRLEERSLEPRGRSEAEALKWSQRKSRYGYAEFVKKQCGAAHAATLGLTRTPESVIAGARTIYLRSVRSGRRGYRDENRLGDALEVAGVKLDRQFAIHRYNLDLAVSAERVAVEVVSSKLKTPYTVTLHERTKYLLHAGWFVLFVNVVKGSDRKKILWPSIVQSVLSHLERARRDEALHGRYLVVGRQGKPSSLLRKYLNDLPRVPHTSSE